MEVSFRPFPEHELWAADVAYLSAARFRQADPEDNIQGAPDLVIEVLSPSNTASEMLDRERICLANGAREFWVVDPASCLIRVITHDKKVSKSPCRCSDRKRGSMSPMSSTTRARLKRPVLCGLA